MGEISQLLGRKDLLMVTCLLLCIVCAIIGWHSTVITNILHQAPWPSDALAAVRVAAILFACVFLGFFVVLLRRREDKTREKGEAVVQTTSGANSPIVSGQVAAARDVHINVPPISGGHQEKEAFAQLKQTIPALLQELRNELKEDPLIRDIIYLERKSITYNWPTTHLVFSEDDHKDMRRKLQVLQNSGMIEEIREGFAYRISERLVRYLKEKPL